MSTKTEDILSDIKIVTKNGREYRSHKVILASGSKYFMEVFRSTTPHCPNPLPVPMAA